MRTVIFAQEIQEFVREDLKIERTERDFEWAMVCVSAWERWKGARGWYGRTTAEAKPLSGQELEKAIQKLFSTNTSGPRSSEGIALQRGLFKKYFNELENLDNWIERADLATRAALAEGAEMIVELRRRVAELEGEV